MQFRIDNPETHNIEHTRNMTKTSKAIIKIQHNKTKKTHKAQTVANPRSRDSVQFNPGFFVNRVSQKK
jgi:hypothetical protein